MSQPQSESSHETRSKSKSKNWYKFDCTMFQWPAMIRLKRRGGFDFLGVLLEFTARLRMTEDYQIRESDLDDIFFSMHGDPILMRRAIEAASEEGLLFNNDGLISCPFLNEQLFEYDVKCEHLSANAKLPRAIAKESVAIAKGIVANRSNLISSHLSNASEGVQGETDPAIIEAAVEAIAIGREVYGIPQPPSNGSPKQEVPPPEKDSTETKLLKLAMSVLDEPDGTKAWENTNIFMLTGRRPLKNHPQIFFTGSELADAFKQFMDAGLVQADFKTALSDADKELTSRKAAQKPIQPERVPSWITNFILTNILEKKIKVNKLKAQEARQR